MATTERRNAKTLRARTPTADDPIGLGWAVADPFGGESQAIRVRIPSGMAERVVELLDGAGMLDHAESVLSLVAELYRRTRTTRRAGDYIPLGRRHTDPDAGTGSLKVETYLPRNVVSKLLGDHRHGRPGLLKPVVESDGRWQRPGNALGKEPKCLGYRIAPEWMDGHPPVAWTIIAARFPAVARRMADAQRAKRERITATLVGLSEGVRHVWESGRRLVRADDLPARYLHDPHQDYFDGTDAGYLLRCRQGRLHYPVTVIPRDCRYAYRFDGPDTEPLGICDVRAVQPLIVAWLARQVEGGVLTAGTTPASPQRGENTLPGTYQSTPGHYLSPSSHVGKNDLLYSGGDWLTRVAHDCRTGVYYRRFVPELERRRAEWVARQGREVRSLPFADARVGRVKKLWMSGVYGRWVGRWGAWDSHPLVVAMAVIYPEMHSALREMVRKTPHGHLARLAQRYESYVMVDRVVPRLHREYPDQPFGLIHDAVLARRSFLPQVERVIREEWTLAFGVVPGLSTTWCDPPAEKTLGREKGRRRKGR